MNTILLIAAIAVRNPFWPIGFEGEHQVISPEPVVDVNPVAEETRDDTVTAVTVASVSKTITGKHWIEARKSLRIGGIAMVTKPDGSKRQSVMINGLVYGDGDYISANLYNRRFTWRVQGLTEGATLKLIRIRAKIITEADSSKGEAK